MNQHAVPKTLMAFIWHFISMQRTAFIVIQILALAWALDNTVWPYAMKLLIDRIIDFTDDKALMWKILAPVLIFWAVSWIIIEIMYRVQGFISAKVTPQFEANIRMYMFDYVRKHSYRYFSDHFAGNIANKISDITTSSTRVIGLFIYLFMPAFIALCIGTSLFFIVNPYFAIIIVLWVAIHMGICFGTAKKCSQLAKVHAEKRSDLSGKIVDTLTNIINVKLFARGQYEQKQMWRSQYEERDKQYATFRYIEYVRLSLSVASLLLPGVLLTWLMLYSWQQGYISVGDVVLTFTLVGNLMMLTWISGIELPNFFKEVGTCQQALFLIQSQHEITDLPKAPDLKITQGEIVFANVGFYYHQNQPVFVNKNIKIHAGEKVGLVGYSGSGKTTFVNLIMRFFDVSAGEILIDGQNIRTVTKNSLRKNIAMIEQQPTLFHRSLWDNICYGNLEATDEQVIAASKAAHCHEFISQLKAGYASLVGERGIKLSGGQRQRVALARAILKNAPILILDEATSALDSATEQIIQKSLNALMENRTTIVIAHRLSTLAQMDRILVFDQGKIIESGSHVSLLEAGGHYAMLWRMQAGGFLPERPKETAVI